MVKARYLREGTICVFLKELFHNAGALKNAKLAGKMSPGLKGFSGGALTGNGDFDKISPRDEAAAATRPGREMSAHLGQ